MLFVIRDHVGSTPLANLSNTLRADLERIWHGLSKPEGLEDCKITDYFDFMFTTLAHKLLQPEKFESDVDQLRLRFTNPTDPNYVFQPQYSKRVPADGLHIYAGGIWDKIMTNKDLDLPTQQELLAQYRCDEIANAAFAIFAEKIKEFRQPVESGSIVEDLGEKMQEIRGTAMSMSLQSTFCLVVLPQKTSEYSSYLILLLSNEQSLSTRRPPVITLKCTSASVVKCSPRPTLCWRLISWVS